MDKILPEYCAVIRTLGTGGSKYQRLLNDLKNQRWAPKQIIVYLAEGYKSPEETVGMERIVRVGKGMVAQRALPYDEVDTEWMLMLDDDFAIEPDGVERLFIELMERNADVIAVDYFPHHTLPFKTRLAMALMFTSIPRLYGQEKGYTVNLLGTDCYKPSVKCRSAWSTTNAGGVVLCRKSDFFKIHFDEDLWLDDAPYSIPDDKVMFYKMHLAGLKILTHYNSGFKHLDGGTSMCGDRDEKIAYSMARNFRIYYYLYIWPNLPFWKKIIAKILFAYQSVVKRIYYILQRINGKNLSEARKRGLDDGRTYIENLKHR